MVTLSYGKQKRLQFYLAKVSEAHEKAVIAADPKVREKWEQSAQLWRAIYDHLKEELKR